MMTLDLIKSTERAPHKGASYLEVLSRFHKFLNPKTYFEIGTLTGSTLQSVECPSIAVDPMFQISSGVIGKKPVLHLFQKTSDDFFRDHNPASIFGGEIDLAFLDGLHWYEVLLRDFMNTEKHCRKNSVIILHDCIPTDLYVGRRAQRSMQDFASQVPHPGWWAGDVWKTACILKNARPDLRIHAFDAPPTGLVCITNLDPSSTVLEDNYFDLVSSLTDTASDAENFAAFYENLSVLSTDRLSKPDTMSNYFWL